MDPNPHKSRICIVDAKTFIDLENRRIEYKSSIWRVYLNVRNQLEAISANMFITDECPFRFVER